MNIAKYEELTGTTVPASRQAYVLAQIKRVQKTLETMLGYTLDKSKSQQNYYEEAGKSPAEFVYPDSDDDLVAADEVINAYRLYPYNEHDPFLAVDPFTSLNVVKLVFMRAGEDRDGVTLKTFDTDEVRIQVGREGLSKFIHKVPECWLACSCSEEGSVQLAVDAYWLYDSCLPSDLEYVWADMVTYYSNPKLGVKSETLGPHSYTLAQDAAPETVDSNLAVIKQYAGPFGSVKRTITL